MFDTEDDDAARTTLDRLAALVSHLGECDLETARAAVLAVAGDDLPTTKDQRLLVVARALVRLRRTASE
jgi:hypothetical protein